MSTLLDRPLALVILDGWGRSEPSERNAIAAAHTPYYDAICTNYSGTTLVASGPRVGISKGAPGNAEVGHLNIGAGCVVQTDAVRIAEAVRDESFFENPVLRNAFSRAAREGKRVHLVGLVSDGEVHSSLESLYALLRMAKRSGAGDVFVHAILDGRDVLPRTAEVYIEALEIKMGDVGVGKIASLCGRFLAMDSGENWERTARVYTMLVHGEGERVTDARAAIRNSFLRGLSDEFIAPIVVEDREGKPLARIQDGDAVIFFNHRADAMRQLARSVALKGGGGQSLGSKPAVHTVCLTEYDRSFGLAVAFPPVTSQSSLAHVFAAMRIPNYRIAETDRFPHVTDIFNGGIGMVGSTEQHLMVKSSGSIATFDEPEMESFKIADAFLRTIDKDPKGVFIVNFAAPGFAASSRDFGRAVESVQFADTCLGGVVEKMREIGGVTVVTSSHGACEAVAAPDEVSTSGFGNVPLHIIDDAQRDTRLLDDGALEDVAPTVLGILGIAKPAEMTGRDLRVP